MSALLFFAAIAAYLIASLWQLRILATNSRSLQRGPALLALLAAGLHASVHLVLLTSSGGPALHFYGALSVIGLGTAALSAGISLLRPIAPLGLIVYPLAALMLGLYQQLPVSARLANSLGWQIQLHAALALLAYAALSLAALLAITLWLQERGLRQRRFGAFLRVIPPLTLVESLMFRLIGTGFALLTLALITGAVFVDNLFAQHLVHKTVLSLLAWGIFGTLLLGRYREGWRGRRAVRLTLVAMGLLALAFFGSKFVLELVLARGG